uniref:NADH-ubiquinone oxidoreductase chain 1 n=1 Tax=Auchenoplax crinita TaxID=397536 RepID=G8XXK5_AUCCR|nr:NADH dehydrogenase subunit 1 [Auchenoplax crinita]
MYVSFCVSILATFLCAMLAMSFYTLFERKALGYVQDRKGPNKVGLMGVPQPFADAIKLFTKESILPKSANYIPFFLSPMFSLVLSLFMWSLYPHSYVSVMSKFGVLMFPVISSLSVYGVMIAGWSSNSKYALLGSLRGVAQTISYEISMTLILLSPLCVYCCFNMVEFSRQVLIIPMFMFFHLFFMWCVSVLAETNRTPFDFAEGESELVSGFNTEYSAFQFAVLFMAEYTSIIIVSMFTAVFFLFSVSIYYSSILSLVFYCVMVSFGFIWVRASLPRMRYDKLMALTWKTFLPMSLSMLMIICSILAIL